jgi:hypothetical protein
MGLNNREPTSGQAIGIPLNSERKIMRKYAFLAALAVLDIASPCAAAYAQPQAPVNCQWESGYIRAKDALQGPILIHSLMPAADDPGQISAGEHFVIVSSHNVGFPIENFNGPFFLPAGARLSIGKEWPVGGFLYSGCRM